MKILLIGPAASGKGTIGKKLSEFLGLPLVTPGQLLRDVPRSNPRYEEIQKDMNEGKLVDPSIVGELLKTATQVSKCPKGYILDGWLRQFADFDYFDPDPDIVIFFNISYDTSKIRIINRLTCPICKRNYNTSTNPPKTPGICDYDAETLIRRTDDTLESLDMRWKIFREETLKVIQMFRDKGILIELDGTYSPDKVFSDLLGKLKLQNTL